MEIKVNNNIEDYYIIDILNVYIGFEDKTEARIRCVKSYEIYLNDEESNLTFYSNLNNAEILNHFTGNKTNHIEYVNLEAKIGIPETSDTYMMYQLIPCDMEIVSYDTSRLVGEENYVMISLEGNIK